MTAKEAQAVAQQLGAIEPNDQKLQKEIERLSRRNTLDWKLLSFWWEQTVWIR